jgi:hypothetical protein
LTSQKSIQTVGNNLIHVVFPMIPLLLPAKSNSFRITTKKTPNINIIVDNFGKLVVKDDRYAQSLCVIDKLITTKVIPLQNKNVGRFNQAGCTVKLIRTDDRPCNFNYNPSNKIMTIITPLQ